MAAADTSSLQLLSKLLRQSEEEDREDELDNESKPSPYATPGVIGPRLNNNSVPSKDQPCTTLSNDKDIWKTDEVSQGIEYDYNDPRKEPEYEMLFRQAVGSEDVFLGMGNKTPLTSSCNELLVRVTLPNTPFKDVDLIVTEKYLDCRSPDYRLGLHLPHTIDPDTSSAKWLNSKNVLEVSLNLVREYDFINQ